MLSNASKGKSTVDDIVELDRRKEKARLLREFGKDCKGYASRFDYVSGSGKNSNEKRATYLDLARNHIEAALEDLGWKGN